jgi:hypothetical protein
MTGFPGFMGIFPHPAAAARAQANEADVSGNPWFSIEKLQRRTEALEANLEFYEEFLQDNYPEKWQRWEVFLERKCQEEASRRLEEERIQRIHQEQVEEENEKELQRLLTQRNDSRKREEEQREEQRKKQDKDTSYTILILILIPFLFFACAPR